jgi:hypothetical protein
VPTRLQAIHRPLHHFVANAVGSDEAVLAALCGYVLPLIKQRGAV